MHEVELRTGVHDHGNVARTDRPRRGSVAWREDRARVEQFHDVLHKVGHDQLACAAHR